MFGALLPVPQLPVLSAPSPCRSSVSPQPIPYPPSSGKPPVSSAVRRGHVLWRRSESRELDMSTREKNLLGFAAARVGSASITQHQLITSQQHTVTPILPRPLACGSVVAIASCLPCASNSESNVYTDQRRKREKRKRGSQQQEEVN